MKNAPKCSECKHYDEDANMPWIGKCATLKDELNLMFAPDVNEDFCCCQWECKNGLWEAEVTLT